MTGLLCPLARIALCLIFVFGFLRMVANARLDLVHFLFVQCTLCSTRSLYA
jgi:hypothetical protein